MYRVVDSGRTGMVVAAWPCREVGFLCDIEDPDSVLFVFSSSISRTLRVVSPACVSILLVVVDAEYSLMKAVSFSSGGGVVVDCPTRDFVIVISLLSLNVVICDLVRALAVGLPAVEYCVREALD